MVPNYKIEELDWTLLKGTFYDQDLQIVKVPRMIYSERTKYDSWKTTEKYDSWIDKKDVKRFEKFYITLPSHRNRAKFSQNQSNHFKIYQVSRIWKVGLFSISLPDVKVHLPKLVDWNEILFTVDWIIKYPSGALKFCRAPTIRKISEPW